MGDLTAQLQGAQLQGAQLLGAVRSLSVCEGGPGRELNTQRRPYCRVHGETLLLFELNDYILC